MANVVDISFEFFPPKNQLGTEKLLGEVLENLSVFEPEFISVTYGAGGSTRDGTYKTIQQLCHQDLVSVPHLSVGNEPDAQIIELIASYKKLGVSKILALRGDTPSGFGSAKIKNASYLTRLIRQEFGDDLEVVVAAYPEVHPDSKDLKTDISFFKEKVNAGASSAITQYFYNADAYANYLKLAEKHNIQIPITPGVMPINNVDGLLKMSSQCKAEIPRWLEYSLKNRTDSKDLNRFGADVVTKLCEKLIAMGAPGLHFYTLNRWGATSKICHQLGVGSK
ncbi:methylenetetrahydrofolate reductase [Gammaproteobacteria bacterium]|nr:methylenetetrahydrofolate reductase [Gammaproteobacteria bacterium]